MRGSYRRNRVHLKRTNDPPPKLTFEESSKASSYPDGHWRPSAFGGNSWRWASLMHWALQGHSGARRCWNDQIPFGVNCENTRRSKGLCDWNNCHRTLKFKPAVGISVAVNDSRLLLLSIDFWTFVIDLALTTMHDLAIFFFVIYSDLVLDSSSFVLLLLFFNFSFPYWGCNMLLRHWFPVCTCGVVVKTVCMRMKLWSLFLVFFCLSNLWG